mmetsp:Transcript_15071/g.31500  ORF Transcript_15071/g.31500 Transcript_15071/m.31500 type:complete len:281 (-) Transcript_15071:51-893(-)
MFGSLEPLLRPWCLASLLAERLRAMASTGDGGDTLLLAQRRQSRRRLMPLALLTVAAVASIARLTLAFAPQAPLAILQPRPSRREPDSLVQRRGAMVEVPGDLKKWMKILVDDAPCQILSHDPKNQGGKGRWISYTRLKNLITGVESDVTLKGGARYEQIDTTVKDAIYSYYNEAERSYVFLDSETFEEIMLTEDFLGEVTEWLTEEVVVELERYAGRCIKVGFKDDIVSEVATADYPSGNSGKQVVTLVNGLQKLGPLYLKQGDKVLVHPKTFEITSRL